MIKPNLLLNLNTYHQSKSHQREISNDSGFALIEVLVTILVVTGFLLGSLQATVLATLIRVNTQDKQQAINWIQQDLELINFQAFSLNYNSTTEKYTPDPTTCTAKNYGSYLQNNTNFKNSFPSSQPNVSISGNNYNVTRTYNPTSNTLQVEYKIEYASTHPRYKGSTGNNELATLSTEVFPNAVLSCP